MYFQNVYLFTLKRSRKVQNWASSQQVPKWRIPASTRLLKMCLSKWLRRPVLQRESENHSTSKERLNISSKLQPAGCGSILKASTAYETLRDRVGDRLAGTKEREDFVKCYYWITVTTSCSFVPDHKLYASFSHHQEQILKSKWWASLGASRLTDAGMQELKSKHIRISA